MSKGKYVLLTGLFLIMGTAYAETKQQTFENTNNCKPLAPYYKDARRGWFYGEFCEDKKPDTVKKQKEHEKEQTPQQSPSIDWARLADKNYLEGLNMKEFRDLYEKVKDETYYRPTFKKVKALATMTDFMRAKSLETAYIWQDVIISNPELDPTKVIPTHSGGVYAKLRAESSSKKEKMKDIVKNTGIYFFVSAACPYCHEEAKIINWLISDYKLTVKSIASDECIPQYPNCTVSPAHFEKFGVTTTPSVFMVYNDNGKPIIQPIGVGLMSLETIINRIIHYYDYIKTGKHPLY